MDVDAEASQVFKFRWRSCVVLLDGISLRPDYRARINDLTLLAPLLERDN
jgi:hypothetical protein